LEFSPTATMVKNLIFLAKTININVEMQPRQVLIIMVIADDGHIYINAIDHLIPGAHAITVRMRKIMYASLCSNKNPVKMRENNARTSVNICVFRGKMDELRFDMPCIKCCDNKSRIWLECFVKIILYSLLNTRKIMLNPDIALSPQTQRVFRNALEMMNKKIC
jgi:hypothetical protein